MMAETLPKMLAYIRAAQELTDRIDDTKMNYSYKTGNNMQLEDIVAIKKISLIK